jgi:hypothetical protein
MQLLEQGVHTLEQSRRLRLGDVELSRPDVPGVLQIASLAGPYKVIARAKAQDVGELAKQITCRVNAPTARHPR